MVDILKQRRADALEQPGQVRSLHELFSQAYKIYYSFLVNVIGDSYRFPPWFNADDAVQEAYVRTMTRLQTPPPPAVITLIDARRYLEQAATNYIIDTKRRKINQRTDSMQQIDPDGERFGLIQDEHVDVQRAVEGRATARILQATGELLPPDQWQMIRLRHADELSYGEIAQVLGITESAVRSRLFRARQALKRALIATGIPPEDL